VTADDAVTADIGMPVGTSPAGVRVERVVTSGAFELDGGSWEVENNVWLVGDDGEVLVVDAAHDAGAILRAVGDRRLVAVVCTHGHNDHVNAAGAVVAATGATAHLHPDDRALWDQSQTEPPGAELADGQVFTVGDVELTVLHTPGHAPGACCLYAPALGVLFSGDTLFNGGPGATGRSYSDFPTIVESIRTRLLDLPADTVVLTGHGDPTTVGAEAPHLQEWIARGH
jgi:glyoxylase-like metal-dependent hydrolase (beta-lactamase superfamily II)